MSYHVEHWNHPHPPTASELRAALEAEGYSVFEWADYPGAVYSRHQHADDQSHAVVSGEIELDVEGEGVFILRPGDRDRMPAGTFHTARVVGNEPVRYLIGSRPTMK